MSELTESHLTPQELAEHKKEIANTKATELNPTDRNAQAMAVEDETSRVTAEAFVKERLDLLNQSQERALALMFSRDDWLLEDTPIGRDVLGNPDILKGLITAIQSIDQSILAPAEESRKAPLDITRPEFASAVSICSALGVEDIGKTLTLLTYYWAKSREKAKKFEGFLGSAELENSLKNFEKPSSELTQPELAEQLIFRSKYLKEFLAQHGLKEATLVTLMAASLNPGVRGNIDKLERDTDFDDLDDLNDALSISSVPPEEGQIVLAGLLFSPDLTTKGFVDSLERLQVDAFSDKMFKKFPDQIANTVSTRNDAFKIAVLQGMLDGNLQSWKGKKILEIGGSTASNQLALLGAEPMATADPGHDYYSGNMVQDQNQLLTLENYKQKYGQPHQADLICSAQLFDNGSGIEKTMGGEFGDWDDAYAAYDHVLLTMFNLLKQKDGYMIHDLMPRAETLEKLGIEVVARLSFDIPGSSNVTIFRSTGKVNPEPISIKDHTAELDRENNTWELTK